MTIDLPQLSPVESLKLNNNNPPSRFWLALTLAFAGIYGLLALKKGFSGEWIVQDDARQHVFWMLRFIDPELFPNDLIANYFQSVAPVGYSNLYRLAVAIGINPLIFNKLLPPILGLISSFYCFFLSRQIFPVSATAFITTLMFNQNMWLKDDVISATPRAFAYPLLLAFLYYLSKRSLIPCLITILLLGIFYPQCVFLATGMLILQLFSWKNRRLSFSSNSNDYYFCFMGLGVAFAVMLPYALDVSEFGPVITLAEAKQLPEFYSGGRSSFFQDNWWDYWFGGGRSGMFPISLFTPVTLLFAFCLPIFRVFRQQFPLEKEITTKIAILPQIIIVSVTMFGLAHACLFKLHLPSRYTGYTFRIVVAIAAGIALTLILDVLLRQLRERVNLNLKTIGQKLLSFFFIGAIATGLIFYPYFVEDFPITKYKTGETPNLYQFLQQEPKNILIASLTADADNIPTFAQRSILVSKEYAIPYHMGYYQPFRQRVIDLIQAQYTSDLAKVEQFIHKYGIDLWIIEKSSFTSEYLANNSWIRQHQPVAQEAIQNLKEGKIPILTQYKNSCSVWQDNTFTVMNTECILNKIRN